MSRGLQRVLLGAIACVLTVASADAATFYVAATGRDAQSGLTPALAWRSLARVNRACQSTDLRPGDHVLFRRGDVWHEQLTCGNAATTLTAEPNLRGVTFGAFGAGSPPVLDAANSLEGVRWTRCAGDARGHTWQTTIPQDFFLDAGTTNGAAIHRILKLYMDAAARESTQLLPVSNFTGGFSAGHNHNYLDAVSGDHDEVFLSGSPVAHAYPPSGGASAKFWTRVHPGWTGIANLQGSGLANVMAGYVKPDDATQNHPSYPGVWWSDGSVLYVNLGGADPNAHRFEGTVRTYGVLLENTTGVTVQDLTIEHSFGSGVEAIPVARNDGQYHSTGDTVLQRNHVWNFAGLLTNEQISFAGHGQNGDMGGLLVRWDGAQDPARGYKLPGVVISSNAVGTADLLFGTGAGSVAGVYADGLDGGKVTGNFVKTQLAEGLDLNHSSKGYAAGNELTWNYGNFFHNAFCGQVTRNYVHEFWAEGLQIGGDVANSSACVQDISYNTIVNGYINATGGLYNGIDCNGSALNAGFHIHHNTIVNVWGAGITNESINGSTTAGCQQATIDDNIIDMAHPYFPAGKKLNASNAYYFSGTANLPASLRDNLLILSGNDVRIAGGHHGQGDNATWLAQHDIGSKLDTAEPANLWMSYSGHDFRLKPDAPARALGTNGTEVGAGVQKSAQ